MLFIKSSFFCLKLYIENCFSATAILFFFFYIWDKPSKSLGRLSLSAKKKSYSYFLSSFVVVFLVRGYVIIRPSNETSFYLLEWRGGEHALPQSRQACDVIEARTSGQANLVLPLQTGFLSASIRLLIKTMVVKEPSLPSARLLGLGSKLYPSIKQHMRKKKRY